MELDASKEVCGTCDDWQGKRDWVDGKSIVKPSARGQCKRLNKPQPAQGGCNYWKNFSGGGNGG